MSKDPTMAEIKETLRLPDNEESDKRIEKMLASFGEEYTSKEKLFIIFYTSPTSRTCGKVNQSGMAAGGSWKGYGSWALQQPHVRQRVNELFSATSLQTLEDIFREDIEYNRQVLLCDRTSFKKDNTVELEDKNISFDTLDDKKLSELTPTQKKMVSGFDYDKNGRPHYSIETRASARQALLTYHKLLTQKISGNEDKRTETIVTLEGIRDKATAKIQVIQHNNAEAELAGQFIEPMNDIDEEA